MSCIQNLPLEEKLKIPVMELPFSKKTKDELHYKGILTLGQIYDKYQRDPGRGYWPGFKNMVYAEAAYFIITMGLDLQNKLREVADINIARWSDKKQREKIRTYVNKRL